MAKLTQVGASISSSGTITQVHVWLWHAAGTCWEQDRAWQLPPEALQPAGWTKGVVASNQERPTPGCLRPGRAGGLKPPNSRCVRWQNSPGATRTPESSSKTDRQAGEPACEALTGRQRQREGNSEGRVSPQPCSGPTRVSVPRGGSPIVPPTPPVPKLRRGNVSRGKDEGREQAARSSSIRLRARRLALALVCCKRELQTGSAERRGAGAGEGVICPKDSGSPGKRIPRGRPS